MSVSGGSGSKGNDPDAHLLVPPLPRGTQREEDSRTLEQTSVKVGSLGKSPKSGNKKWGRGSEQERKGEEGGLGHGGFY